MKNKEKIINKVNMKKQKQKIKNNTENDKPPVLNVLSLYEKAKLLYNNEVLFF